MKEHHPQECRSRLFSDGYNAVMKACIPLHQTDEYHHYKDDSALAIHAAAIEALGGEKLTIVDAVAFYHYFRTQQQITSDDIDETQNDTIHCVVTGLELWLVKQFASDPEPALVLCNFLLDALRPDANGGIEFPEDEVPEALDRIKMCIGWLAIYANKARRLAPPNTGWEQK